MSDDGKRMLGDRYEIGEVIGRGGMAEVHEARDLRLGRRVAIKILRPDLAKDSTFQARFRREAQSAASLNHPNIVAVYDTGEDTLIDENGNAVVVPYIVMEYVDGMTLRQLLASGRRLLPERALEITGGVLSALDYAHRHGIVHRDIKPANVMLTRTGEVKVMDFGIARALNDTGTTMTSAQAVMGTAQYLSPEQARGEVVDARSDLYSTGVVLYELLTGRPPFTGDSAVAIAYQHVSEIPQPPSAIDSGVSQEVDAVDLRALAKRVEDRYQTAAEFRADVERAIAGAPVTAAVPSIVSEHTTVLPLVEAAGADFDTRPPGRAGKTGRNAGLWVLGVIAIAAALVGGFFIVQFLNGDGSTSRVNVPNLAGLTVEQAEETLQQFELELGAITPEVSDRPTGTIIAQQPSSGEMLEQGQAVNITISAGREQAVVPQLIALPSIEAVRIALADAGLQLGSITERNSNQPLGYVLGQEPPEGTLVDSGSSIDIEVSSGLSPVPNVVGAREAQARSDLAQAGFEVQVVEQETATVAGGVVLAQSPQAGVELARGSLVTITVSVSAPPPPPPTPEPTLTPEPTPDPTFEPEPPPEPAPVPEG